MIRNQIHKVLSTFQSYGVRALLMGGQACVFYGAAEFSRDTDFAIAIDSDNWARLHGNRPRPMVASLQPVSVLPQSLMAPVQETSEPSIKAASKQRVCGPAENRRQVAPSFPSPVSVVVHVVHPRAEVFR